MKRITCLVLCVGLLGAAEKAMGRMAPQDPTAQEDVRPVPSILVIPIPVPVPVIVLPADKEPEEDKKVKALRARKQKRAARKEIKRLKEELRQENIRSVFHNK